MQVPAGDRAPVTRPLLKWCSRMGIEMTARKRTGALWTVLGKRQRPPTHISRIPPGALEVRPQVHERACFCTHSQSLTYRNIGRLG